MEVALAILFAALVGGVAFMLLDGWQRKRVEPASGAVPFESHSPIWTPAAVTAPASAPQRPIWTPDEDTSRAAWGPPSEEKTEPLPPEPPRREPPPLWTPPPGGTSGHWDDDDRGDGDDDSPPGLWSGWARR